MAETPLDEQGETRERLGRGVASYRGSLPGEDNEGRDASRRAQQAGNRALPVPVDMPEASYCGELVDETIDELSSNESDRTLRIETALRRMERDPANINTASVQAYQPKGRLPGLRAGGPGT